MKLDVGKVYVVSSQDGCDICMPDGTQMVHVPAGEARLFVPQTSDTVVYGEAVMTPVRGGKEMLLGELMGNARPGGITYVEWLESQNGTINNCSFIKLPFYYENKNNNTLRIETLHSMPEAGLASNQAELNNTETNIFWGVQMRGTKYYGFPNDEIIEGSPQVKGFNKKSLIFRNEKLQFFENDELQCEKTGLDSYSFEVLSVFSAYGGNNYPFCGRKKYFKVWINDRLVYDLVPCLDAVGAPCMFDMVSRICYYNQGTGDFLYPGKEEEPATYSLRRPITYAQLTEHGVRRLYRVPSGYNGTKEEYAAEHGFKPLVETEKPEEGYWVPQWRETDEEIVLDWVETEPPAEDYLTQPTE